MPSCLYFDTILWGAQIWDLRVSFLHFRLEYEQKQDMDSPITKLESSLGALTSDLNEVKAKEEELKSAIRKATDDIDHLKEEVKGMLSAPHVKRSLLGYWKV